MPVPVGDRAVTRAPVLTALASLAIASTGCSGIPSLPGATTAPSLAAPARASAAAGGTAGGTSPTVRTSRPSPAPSVHGEVIAGGGISFKDESLAEMAAGYEGVALVRVVAIGAPRWNTPTGERPSEEALHAHDTGLNYWIGRPFTLQLERVLTGRWTAPADRTEWLVAGGQLGADVTEVPGLVPREPRVGEFAVAFTGAWDQGTGLKAYVGSVFPVEPSGEVLTRRPDEGVTIRNIDRLLP